MGVLYDTSHWFLALELKILFQYFALAFKGFAFSSTPTPPPPSPPSKVGIKTFVILRDFSLSHTTVGYGAFRQTKSIVLQVPEDVSIYNQ